MNSSNLFTIAFLALAVSAISLTITKAGIFSSLRQKIEERNEWLGDLVNCPYCTSHWISFVAVIIYRPMTVNSGILIIDLAVSVFVLVALVAMFSWLVYRSYKGLDLPEDQTEEVEKLRSALQLAKQKLVEQNELLKELSETTYEKVS